MMMKMMMVMMMVMMIMTIFYVFVHFSALAWMGLGGERTDPEDGEVTLATFIKNHQHH